MRVLRVFVIVALLASLMMNFILYKKYYNGRAILSVNGQPYAERDLTNMLKAQAGFEVKGRVVERILVEQEAKKQGVYPTQKEVDDAYNDQKEMSWQFARQMEQRPWQINETKARIQQQLAQQRLLVKDTPVTPEEISTEYAARPMAYDTPNKAKGTLAVILDPTIIADVKQLLEKNPPVSPDVIKQQYSTSKVVFLGDEGVFTFVQPFGNTKMNGEIFGMKPGEVKQLPPGELARQGAKALLVRLKEIVPGKKADLNDPKTKEKITTYLALQRGKPWQEKLQKLYFSADIWTDDPQDKRIIQAVLFPDRERANKQ